MARLFDDAVPHYITIGSAILSGVPITLACWFNSDLDDNQGLIQFTEIGSGDNYFHLSAMGGQVGDPIRALTRAGGTSSQADSTGGYSLNTWHHACGVFAAADDRRAFIDGGSKGTEATSRTPTGLDTTAIGAIRISAGNFTPMSGRIAEAAIWNIALTDAEVAILAEGYSPLLVHPQNLVFYAPLIREIIDRVGGVTLTNVGSTVGNHTRVLYPAPSPIVTAPAAVAAALASQRLKIGIGR